jgi:hypothetical protein
MGGVEVTERHAGDDDIKDCPSCGMRDQLVIRWLPDIDYRVHETTEVGCKRCDKFFSGEEDRFAITDWNRYVINENRKKGIVDPHERLYGLLFLEYEAQRKALLARQAVDAYLEEEIVPRCPFNPGDRFIVQGYPGGIWSAESVRAVYGTNT